MIKPITYLRTLDIALVNDEKRCAFLPVLNDDITVGVDHYAKSVGDGVQLIVRQRGEERHTFKHADAHLTIEQVTERTQKLDELRGRKFRKFGAIVIIICNMALNVFVK